jgi:acyl carrier protein
MTREEIRDKIYNVVKETFGACYVSDVMIIEKAYTPDKWDKSMLIINLEEAFNIDIPESDEIIIMTKPIKEITEYIFNRIKERE